jgi:hypothetical protein
VGENKLREDGTLAAPDGGARDTFENGLKKGIRTAQAISKVVSTDRYRWKKHCNGLYTLPVAA